MQCPALHHCALAGNEISKQPNSHWRYVTDTLALCNLHPWLPLALLVAAFPEAWANIWAAPPSPSAGLL